MADRPGSAAGCIDEDCVERRWLERDHGFSIILNDRDACSFVFSTSLAKVLNSREVDVAGNHTLIPARRDHRRFSTRSRAYVENSEPAFSNNRISHKLRTFVLKIH